MRQGFLLISIIALAAGCSSPLGNSLGDNAAQESRSGGAPGDVMVTLTSSVANPCAARWNGEAVTGAEITSRTVRLLEQAIDRAGGIDRVRTESLPRARLEVPPTLTFACVTPMIFAIQRGGIAEILLKPSGATNQPISVYSAFPGEPPASTVIEVGPGQRLIRNGEAADIEALRAWARQYAADNLPPGLLAVSVAEDVTFATAFQLLEAVAGARPILLPPGSGTAPDPVAVPPPLPVRR